MKTRPGPGLVLLAATALLSLTGCNYDRGLGDNVGHFPTKIIGNVIGYDRNAEDVLVLTTNWLPGDNTKYHAGAGTVYGTSLEFTLTTPPVAALHPADLVGFNASNPDLLLATAIVYLSDAEDGAFIPATGDWVADFATMRTGDAYGSLIYASHPGVLNARASSDIEPSAQLFGSAQVSQGWNLISVKATELGNERVLILGVGDLDEFDWYFLGPITF